MRSSLMYWPLWSLIHPIRIFSRSVLLTRIGNGYWGNWPPQDQHSFLLAHFQPKCCFKALTNNSSVPKPDLWFLWQDISSRNLVGADVFVPHQFCASATTLDVPSRMCLMYIFFLCTSFQMSFLVSWWLPWLGRPHSSSDMSFRAETLSPGKSHWDLVPVSFS